MRITYLLWGEILGPAARSQTFPLLRRLRGRGHTVTLVAGVSLRRWLSPRAYREALDEAREAAGGCLRVVHHLPRQRVVWMSRLARRLAGGGAPDVVHARQARAAVLAVRAGVAPVLADLRGLRPEEFLMSAGRPEAALDQRERAALARHREEQRCAVQEAAAVICVSEAFRRRLPRREGVFVIPNAAEPVDDLDPGIRRARRAQLGLREGDFALVYSGSLAAWQCVDETVRLAGAAAGRDARFRLVLLTHDEAAASDLLIREGVSGIVASLSPERTRALLPAFDGALLLRRPDPVSEVSCPVKFVEYLHAGLPVAVSGGVGDVSGWVKEHGLGIVLPPGDEAGRAEAVAEALPRVSREACRAFAREHLTFERTAGRYEQALAFAAGRGPCGSR